MECRDLSTIRVRAGLMASTQGRTDDTHAQTELKLTTINTLETLVSNTSDAAEISVM